MISRSNILEENQDIRNIVIRWRYITNAQEVYNVKSLIRKKSSAEVT